MILADRKICVVGLGYVGLPLAVEFAKTKLAPIIGFDINQDKIKKLLAGIDPTNEVGNQAVENAQINFTFDPAKIRQANFIIIAVPTPIDQNKKPDLNLVKAASELVGLNLAKGSIVVYESTVYPGVTEDICLPILENKSGLQVGIDFKIGYSPERVNPGDKQHTVENIIKIVSGQDAETLEQIAEVYRLIIKAGVYKAPTIKTAEAAKVIENIQRDLNISLMNELSLIFSKLNIDTKEVIAAAATKWNFHQYHPGLVGGHCIGVDPYYLTFRSQQLGYEPEVILAGRHVNDSMPKLVAQMVLSELSDPANSKILILGLSFKENVNDFRNSKAKDVINSLQAAGVQVFGHDPYGSDQEIKNNFGLENSELNNISDLDAIIYLIPHQDFKSLTLSALRQKCRSGKAILFDLRWVYNKNEAEGLGFKYLTF